MTDRALQPRNVIVLGMPRSGTRMTAAIFARQGYFLPNEVDDELQFGSDGKSSGGSNTKGLLERNVALFRRAGFTGHNTWSQAPIAELEADALRRLAPTPEDHAFATAYATHRPWLWKDPRLCYTLAYWWPMIDQENTRVLVIRRRPEETWNSFVRLGWREATEENRRDVLSRIDQHLDAAMLCISQCYIPHLVVHYDEYLAAPATTAARISELFGLSLSVDDLGFDKSLNSTRFPKPVQTTLSGQNSKLSNQFLERKVSAIRNVAS